MSPTVVSAPGKVFLAGGYLVLDRTYTALVFGLSARIHIVVEDIDTSSGVQLSEIVVESPQFREAVWNYGYHLTEEHGGIQVTQLQGAIPVSRNPFVETALAYALTYISTISSSVLKPTKVTILADNDYYSQPSSSAASTATKDASPRFQDFGVKLTEAHKTGLGSSAALVTSFTGALLSHYLPSSLFSLSTEKGKSVLHNLAQAAHCAAQGKVGSGFDVAVAVYGTCKYRRFSPSILSSLGEVGSKGFASRVKSVVENEGGVWDTECEKDLVTIPKGMALVMCDVDCGSNTPSMVKKVLEWRKADPSGSKELMDSLQSSNDVLESKLGAASPSMSELESAFASIRSKIRKMGELSGVPIEPPEQTELLDAVTKNVEGVAGGVVPGAGGYDAIVLLVKDDTQTTEALSRFLESWSKEKGSNVSLLRTKGELEGARVEAAEKYASALVR